MQQLRLFALLKRAGKSIEVREDGGGVIYRASEETIDGRATAAHGGIGGAHVVKGLLNGGYLRIAAENGVVVSLTNTA